MMTLLAETLREALIRLLPRGPGGALSFVREMPGSMVRSLAADKAGFTPPGWNVFAVVGEANRATRCITADMAVEERERLAEGGPNLFLLVDLQAAGAGMDGVYTAGRALTQQQLFSSATTALQQLHPSRELWNFLKAATNAMRQRAPRLQPSHHWHQLEFMCAVASSPKEAGRQLASIGLWPVAHEPGVFPTSRDVQDAENLAFRMFDIQNTRQAAEARVAALRLLPDQQDLGRQLVSFIRRHAGAPKAEALEDLLSTPQLWLGSISPRVFSEGPEIDRIHLMTWIRSTDATYAWSGLQLVDGSLELVLPLEDVRGRAAARLGVRWTTQPADLDRGSVQYRVEIRAGSEVLATREVSHASRAYQAATFTRADFDELDEARILVCQAIVSVMGGSDHDDAEEGDQTEVSPRRAVSLEFKLRFGDQEGAHEEPSQSAGRVYPTMAIAAANLESIDQDLYVTFAQTGHLDGVPAFGADRSGYATIRHKHRAARVVAPRAYVDLARVWSVDHAGAPGRWRVRVRADGSPVSCIGSAEFVRILCPDRPFERASRAFATWVNRPGGPAGAIYHHDNTAAVKAYVDSCVGALRSGPPELALVQTIEVVSIAGQTIGLIVLPTHPMRVAWQQAFDMLVWHARYVSKVDRTELGDIVAACVGSQYPAMLPGAGSVGTFIFGDMLGFHAVALVPEGDPEPKATVALLERALAGTDAERATGSETALKGIAGQIRKYLDLHPAYTRIRAHGLRSGDGMTLSRALGAAVAKMPDEVPAESDVEVAFELNLHPGLQARADLTGRHLSLTAERARKGAGAIAEPDRWLTDVVSRPGGHVVPRLTWARREAPVPQDDAHLAIMFDAFSTVIEPRDADLAQSGRLELYGLFMSPVRRFVSDGEPTWVGHIPTKASGAKHPVSDGLTNRLLALQGAFLDSVGRWNGFAAGSVPVFVTRITVAERETLDTLHRLVDWAITADRNAGIEYFDSPRDPVLSSQHEAYVIDSVPERSDLGAVQLMTSTARSHELQRLLANALGTMDVTQSPRNAEALIRALKAISGRLTMRLASGGSVAQELVALASVQRQCVAGHGEFAVRLNLKTGFFVPLDDVTELFGAGAPASDGIRPFAGSGMRTDLLHVTAGRTGAMTLTFVEAKFRRSLRTARSAQTVTEIEAQLRASNERWGNLFSDRASELRRMISRTRLARILTFYLDKGVRHSLEDTSARYIRREIDKLAHLEGGLPDPLEIRRAGIVFCPEYVPAVPDLLAEGTDLWLFGPATLPDRSVTAPPLAPVTNESIETDDRTMTDQTERGSLAPRTGLDASEATDEGGTASSELGTTAFKATPGLAPVGTGEAWPEERTGPMQAAASEVPLEQARAGNVETATGAIDSGVSLGTIESDRRATAPETSDRATTASEGPSKTRDDSARDASPRIVSLLAAKAGASLGGVVLGYPEGSETPTIWRQDIRANPHLMILGLPGMGKTSALLNICEQLIAQRITPIVFSYHEDIDEKLGAIGSLSPVFVNHESLGFNPMRVSSIAPFAHIDSVGNLRDIFSAVFPDLGEVQLGKLREAILKSYTDRGWSRGVRGETPPFAAFYETLSADPKPDRGLNLRLRELADYGLFESDHGESSLLDVSDPVVIQIHKSQNDTLQRAFSIFILYNLYQNMFKRGLGDRITHAIIFDEGHRASRLKLIPTMARECRKYGLSFILASQEARDFDSGVFTAIANYLALRVNEDDAKFLSRQFADAAQVRAYADRIKAIPKHHAYYFGEQAGRPVRVRLIQGIREIRT